MSMHLQKVFLRVTFIPAGIMFIVAVVWSFIDWSSPNPARLIIILCVYMLFWAGIAKLLRKGGRQEEFEERARAFLERTNDFALRRALSATPRSLDMVVWALHPFASTHFSDAEEAILAEADGDLTKVGPGLRQRVENAEEAKALQALFQELNDAN